MRGARWLGALMVALLLGGCGFLPFATQDGEAEPGVFVVLPGPDDLVPQHVAGVGDWATLSSRPDAFEPGPAHVTPEALAEAYARAIGAPAAGVAGTTEQPEGRVLVVLNVEGPGDDSVAGTQYALVVVDGDAGWVLDEVLARPLCTRGVADGICV